MINIGSGNGASLNQVLEIIGEVLGAPPLCIRREARNFDVPAIWLDIRRAQEILNWAPRISLRDGIREFIAELRARSPS